MEALPQELSIENCSMNAEILENEAGEITVCYLLQKLKMVSWKRAGVLISINNYILGLIWEIDATKYLFNSDNKDENGNLLSFF